MTKRAVCVTSGAEGDLLTGIFRRGGGYSTKRRAPADLIEQFGREQMV